MGGITRCYLCGEELAIEPQWSPPLMGGITGTLQRRLGWKKTTAMEPAADGRDHLSRRVVMAWGGRDRNGAGR